MGESSYLRRLRTVTAGLTCGSWGSPTILSPIRYREKIEKEYARQPGITTLARLEQARGKAWAVVFQRPPVPDARGGPASSEPLEAIAAFSPHEVMAMTPEAIRTVLIGVIAEREVHEVLEWAQLDAHPNMPIINPHHRTPELEDVMERLHRAILDHAH